MMPTQFAMRNLAAIALLSALATIAACTKINPGVCCSSESDCDAVGLPVSATCPDGLACVDHGCAMVACIGPSDCTNSALPFCVDHVCTACDSSASSGNNGCTAEAAVCLAPAETCGGCTVRGDCSGFAATPACKSDGTCVQCVAKTDCSGATPACGPNNTCVACTENGDCSGTTPACRVADNTCVACVVNHDCPLTSPVCGSDNTCGACTQDSDCTSGFCNEQIGACASDEQIVFMDPGGLGSACTRGAPCGKFVDAVPLLSGDRSYLLMLPGTSNYDTGNALINGKNIVAHADGSTFGFTQAELGSGQVFLQFTNSTSRWRGGKVSPISIGGGSETLIAVANSSVDLSNLTIAGSFLASTVDAVGIAATQASEVHLRNVAITGLDATEQGNAAAHQGTAISIANSSLVGNQVSIANSFAPLVTKGSTLALDNVIITGAGTTPVQLDSTQGTITEATIANTNSAVVDWGVVCTSMTSPGVTISNSILWTTSSTQTGPNVISGSFCTLKNSDYTIRAHVDPIISTCESADPLFVDPSNDFHLMTGSPAIDFATTGGSVDFDGVSRPQGAGFDVGAYEFH